MICRHWDNTYSEERIRSLPPYEAFTFQHGHGHEELAMEYMANGIQGWQYFNVMSHPDPSWTNVPWHKLVSEIVPKLSVHEVLMGPGGAEPQDARPVKGWAYGRPLWDHAALDHGKLMALAQEVKNLIVPGVSRVFLDLTLTLREWMCVPHTDYYLLDPGTIENQPRRLRQLITRIARVTGIPTVSNGDRRDDWGSLYLEYANWNWAIDSAVWQINRENVLSVDASIPLYVDRLVELHRGNPKRWIAFSGWDEYDVDQAYEAAVID